jgi:hypothetical protein
MKIVSEDGRFVDPHPAFEGRNIGQRSQGEVLDVSDSELGDWEDIASSADHIDVCDDVDDVDGDDNGAMDEDTNKEQQ